MAAQTHRLANAAVSGFGQLLLTDQTAATTASGWTLGKTATANFSEMVWGTERAATTFAAGTQPGTIGTTNAFRSDQPISGVFDNANWTITVAFRSVTTAYSGTIRARVRVFKSANANGTSATELTSSTQIGTTTGAGSTSADTTSTVTWAPGAVLTFTNEYLFITVACEIVTASGSNSADALLRTGSAATTGTRVLTANFSYADSGTVNVVVTPDSTQAYATLSSGTATVYATVQDAGFSDQLDTGIGPRIFPVEVYNTGSRTSTGTGQHINLPDAAGSTDGFAFQVDKGATFDFTGAVYVIHIANLSTPSGDSGLVVNIGSDVNGSYPHCLNWIVSDPSDVSKYKVHSRIQTDTFGNPAGSDVTVTGVTGPDLWVRARYDGSTFYVDYSTNGTSWTNVASLTSQNWMKRVWITGQNTSMAAESFDLKDMSLILASLVEIAQFVEAPTIRATVSPSFGEAAAIGDAGTVNPIVNFSSLEAGPWDDAATVSVKTTLSVLADGTAVTYVESPGVIDNMAAMTSADVFGTGFTTTGGRAQSFVPVASGYIDVVGLVVSKVGSPTYNIKADVVADNSGVPSSTVLASLTYPAANINTSAGVIYMPLSSPLAVIGGTRYWLSLSRDAGTGSAFYHYVESNTYPNGSFYSFSGTWADQNYDVLFAVRFTQQPQQLLVAVTPSGSEVAGYVDAITATVHVDASPSFEEYYQPSGVEYTDSGTASAVVSPSVVETAEFVDSAIVGSVVTPSSVEVTVFSDVGTAGSVVTPSGVDTAQYVETAIAAAVVTPSGVEIAGLVDSGVITASVTPSVAEFAETVDSGMVTVATVPTAEEFAQLVDSATVGIGVVPNVAEFAEFGDESVIVVSASTSVVDVAAFVDSATIGIGVSPTVVEAAEFVDTGQANIVVVFSGDDVFLTPGTDVGTFYTDVQPSGVDVFEAVEGVTVPTTVTPSAVEVQQFVYVDSAEADIVITFNLEELTGAGYVDTIDVTSTVTPSVVELVEYIDEFTAIAAVEFSAVEEYAPATYDTATIPANIILSYVEVYEFVEITVIGVVIGSSFSEGVRVSYELAGIAFRKWHGRLERRG